MVHSWSNEQQVQKLWSNSVMQYWCKYYANNNYLYEIENFNNSSIWLFSHHIHWFRYTIIIISVKLAVKRQCDIKPFNCKSSFFSHKTTWNIYNQRSKIEKASFKFCACNIVSRNKCRIQNNVDVDSNVSGKSPMYIRPLLCGARLEFHLGWDSTETKSVI